MSSMYGQHRPGVMAARSPGSVLRARTASPGARLARDRWTDPSTGHIIVTDYLNPLDDGRPAITATPLPEEA